MTPRAVTSRRVDELVGELERSLQDSEAAQPFEPVR